ncbi:MAG: hypothetical protein KC591_15520, partial [Gemmatimonadetes bacterium]|nr:hypothetical protein [Gemmatimonadota bacterium]
MTSGRHARRVALLAGTLAAALAPTFAAAADLTLQGCNELLAGEVGIRELIGNVDDVITVPVTVHTLGPIDAFRLEVEVPPGLVEYVSTSPGNLTQSFTFGGNWFDAQSKVRIVGSNVNPIPGGSVGRLAEITFRVLASGDDVFTLSGFLDDLTTYQSCYAAHGPSPVDVLGWGRIKSTYR